LKYWDPSPQRNDLAVRLMGEHTKARNRSASVISSLLDHCSQASSSIMANASYCKYINFDVKNLKLLSFSRLSDSFLGNAFSFGIAQLRDHLYRCSPIDSNITNGQTSCQ
jgi:hypothetical protein